MCRVFLSHCQAKMGYAVYKVPFQRPVDPDHVALFVDDGNQQGFLFHATDTMGTRTEIVMKFEEKWFSLATSASAKTPQFLGMIEEDQVGAIRRVCESVPPPRRLRLTETKPDCHTWLDSVISKLHSEGIISS